MIVGQKCRVGGDENWVILQYLRNVFNSDLEMDIFFILLVPDSDKEKGCFL